jgi:hypothetical protein
MLVANMHDAGCVLPFAGCGATSVPDPRIVVASFRLTSRHGMLFASAMATFGGLGLAVGLPPELPPLLLRALATLLPALLLPPHADIASATSASIPKTRHAKITLRILSRSVVGDHSHARLG